MRARCGELAKISKQYSEVPRAGVLLIRTCRPRDATHGSNRARVVGTTARIGEGHEGRVVCPEQSSVFSAADATREAYLHGAGKTGARFEGTRIPRQRQANARKPHHPTGFAPPLGCKHTRSVLLVPGGRESAIDQSPRHPPVHAGGSGHAYG